MSALTSYFDREAIIRAAVAVVVFLLAVIVVPEIAGADWITTSTSVAIYSVVALGFGILYGRVGMISLGQVALLTIGCWIGARLSYATSLPFPVLLLLTGALTCVIGVLVGLPALRLSGLYLALITLMFAGATTIFLSVTDFPNGGGGWSGVSVGGHADDEHAAGASAELGDRRRRVLSLHGDRGSHPVPARARPRRGQARARLGDDSRERAGCDRRRRQHHALQALGVRARLVRHGRRGLPARRAGRRAARDHVPDAGLADARRDSADRRDLQPLGRGDRRPVQPAAAVPLPGAVGPEPELPADPLRRRSAPGAADGAGRPRQSVPEGHGEPRPPHLPRACGSSCRRRSGGA